jgi:hypothetical protein
VDDDENHFRRDFRPSPRRRRPDPELPRYETPGSILVEVFGEGEDREFEVQDWDENTSVFWISEGAGFDWWLEQHVEFPAPGLYLIENIRGEYIRGEWGYSEDEENWYYDDPPRRIVSALAEIARLRAFNARLVTACRAVLNIETSPMGTAYELPRALSEVRAALEATQEEAP